MDQYVIYAHPTDAPEKFVVRHWQVGAGTVTPGEAVEVDSLEEARALVPGGLHRVPRDEHDEPHIVETWL